MNIYDASEQAYKNGYDKGYAEALKDVLTSYLHNDEVYIPSLLEELAKQKGLKFN